MLAAFPLVFLLEIFCLYHAYKNGTEQKWFWLIVVLPLIGSLIYLYYHFFNRVTVDDISENITKVVSNNYQIDKLEKEVAFSGTVSNKTLLAAEYLNVGAFEKAISLFESCLKGTNAGDTELLMGLVKAKYLNKEYDEVVKYGKQLENEKEFEKADERIAYAWSLFNTDNHRKAEEIFQTMDHQFSNYKHRLEYGNFLIQENRSNEAKELLSTLINEIDHMDRVEKRSNKIIYNDIKSLHDSIQ